MQIQEVFERNIHRSINGVVKADQLDAQSVWQELDEFVVTKELTRHFDDLIDVLKSAVKSPNSGKNGIWVSGFFGCGKSHFIKMMSYLLENREHSFQAQQRKAVDFFESKFSGQLFSDLKVAVAANTDTILFNIDTKADHKHGRDALLQVFLRVLNEKQGFSGDHPHIAHMERYLSEKGKLEAFQNAFERETQESWVKERDAWEFYRDQVVTALSEALGQSGASVEKWVDGAEANFSLTIENFAGWVRDYLDSKGPNHRIMFLIDEVGQFIGRDTHLMLNLQTITEILGSKCEGRAWVIVTSQEDLDAVLGDMNNARLHDFSKIQGRFLTRLSLSSANVDEVIKKRLLHKSEEAIPALETAYEGKQDILRNQLSFHNAGKAFKNYTDPIDFASCYPFAAYQFALVQRVFESIRKAGATGLHLSQGERSVLDAFQNAAKQVGAQPLGALVPFYRFYPAIESFLDTTVKRTIEQASENHVLEPFDIKILQVLFLIRYVDELPGNVDNLVTLCIDQIDADRLSLRREIEESLARLESQTLIARNGDLYFFLTNEERDIGREIKSIQILSGAEERELGKLIFEDVLGDIRKHNYSLTKSDFAITRSCDDFVVGTRVEGNLEVSFISPIGDKYVEFRDDSRCILHSTSEEAQVLIRLPDDASLGRELRTYLQTENYVKAKPTGTLPETTKRILRDRTEENRERRSRIVKTLKGMIETASYFASGQKLNIKHGDPKDALGDALEYLIQNAFPKMGLIEHFHTEPLKEIQSVLRANNLEQMSLSITNSESNPQALEDLREYIRLCTLTNKQMVLRDIIDKRYAIRPYGWPEQEVVLLIARLAVLKEISLILNAAPLPLDQAYQHLTSVSKQKQVEIVQRKSVSSDVLTKAKALGLELFAETGPNVEEELFHFLRAHLASWNTQLQSYLQLAKTSNYPGQQEIEGALGLIRKFVEEEDSSLFLERFLNSKNELLDLQEDYQDIHGFYENQRHSWDQLRKTHSELLQNELQLRQHAEASHAMEQMKAILGHPRPYNQLHQAADLTHTAKAANDALITTAKAPAVQQIENSIAHIQAELTKAKSDEKLQELVTDLLERRATSELQSLLNQLEKQTSIAHIAQLRQTAEAAFETAISLLEQTLVVPPEPVIDIVGPDPPPPPLIKKRRVVEPKTLWQKGFIETSADMNEFLTQLRDEMESALEANERIQIK